MAGDVLKKVRTGDPLEIPAAAYNAFIEAAKAHRSQHRDPSTRQSIPTTGTVLIRNDSDQDVPRYGVLGIDRPIIGPGDNEQAFKNRVALSGVVPEVDRHTGRFAILAEPLKKGKIGRAFVTGVCPVKIRIATDSSGSGSEVVPSSSEPSASSTPPSSSESSSFPSSGSQDASSSASLPASSGTTSGSGSHPQSSGSTGSGPGDDSSSASPGGSGSSSGGGSGGGGSGGSGGGGGSEGGGNSGGGSGGSGSAGSGSGSTSDSGSSGSSSASSGGELFFHLSPCEDDSGAEHNLYIRVSDIPAGDEDCVPRPSSSSGDASGSGQGSAGGSGSGGSGDPGGGGSGGGGSGGGSGSGTSGPGASGSQGSGSGSQSSGLSSGQGSASGSGSQIGSSDQGSGGSGQSDDNSSGGHHDGGSSGSTTAQPVAGPLFMADIADQEIGHLVPCPYGAAAVLWTDEAASSDEEAVWAIVRLDGGLTLGQPFLTQIAVADGSSGNCEVPANWTYTVRSLRGDLLEDDVSVLKPRGLGKTTPNSQGYAMAVRVLDGDKAALKLWDAGEIPYHGPCQESSSSGSPSSSASTSSSSSASSNTSSSGSMASSSGGSSSASASASGTPASGSGSQNASGSPSGETSGGGDSGDSGGSGGSGSGASGGGGSGGGSGGGESGGGGSGGGGSGASGGSGSGTSSGSAGSSGSSSDSGSGSSSSGTPPPTTIKYNGLCYSYNYASGVFDLPSDAKVISPGEWWADCNSCKATCCASHSTDVCRGCFSSNSRANMSMEVTEIYTDGSPKVHWKAQFADAPIWCNNPQWGYGAGDEGNNAHYEYDKPTGTWNPTTRQYDYTYSTVTCDNFSMNGGIGGNNTDWGISVWACKGYPADQYATMYGPLFAGMGDCRGIHKTFTGDIKFFGPNPNWNPEDPNSPMEIEQTVGTRTVKYDITIKNNTCCWDGQPPGPYSATCHNRGQGQTHCDGTCVEEAPLP